MPSEPTLDGMEELRNPYEPAERRVTRTLAQALTALDAYVVSPAKQVRAKDVHGFVEAGGSRELVVAVGRILSEEAVATFEAQFSWAGGVEVPTSAPASVAVPAQARELLSQASRLLKDRKLSTPQLLSGPIVELRLPPDDPYGEIVIQTYRAGRECEVRVRLGAAQVDQAHAWMLARRPVLVEGKVSSGRGMPLRITQAGSCPSTRRCSRPAELVGNVSVHAFETRHAEPARGEQCPRARARTHVSVKVIATAGLRVWNVATAQEVMTDVAGWPLALVVDEYLRQANASGFEQVRFWQYGYDVALRRERVVLTGMHPPLQFDLKIGDTREASLSLLNAFSDARDIANQSPRAVVVNATDLRQSQPSSDGLVNAGHLQDRCFIEAEVTFAHHRFGVLAADLPGEGSITGPIQAEFARLGRELALQLTATLYGSRLDIASTSSAYSVGHAPKLHMSDPLSYAARAATGIAQAIDAATFAIFEYSWSGDHLTKLIHGVHNRFGGQKWFDEQYSTERQGARLTGTAWQDPSFRFVLDFESAARRLPDRVDQVSLDWHASLLGKVRSVLYAVVGPEDKRFLIRFINHAQMPDLPFLYEAGQLAELVASISPQLHSHVANERHRLFSRATEGLKTSSLDSAHTGAELVALAAPGLQFDGVEAGAFLTRYDDVRGVQVLGGFGNTPLVELSDVWLPEAKDAFLRQVLRASHPDRPARIPIPDVVPEPSVLHDYLATHAGGFTQLAIVRADSAGHQVYALVPLRSSDSKKATQGSPGASDALDALNSYSRLIANALAARNAQLVTAGARRSLGLIAHEIKMPVALLANEAMSAIEEALTIFEQRGSSDPDFPLDMEVWERRIDARREQVNAITKLSDVLAQESVDQTLSLFVAETSLYSLVSEVATDMEYESSVDERLRLTDIEVTGCRGLPMVNCDKALLRLAVTNVVRNAIKYSLPPGLGNNPLVDVSGRVRQSRALIDVTNFGFGIPEAVRPAIFEPFVRGDVKDERKAIRGMGLGLFLARRILEAHGGSVELVFSRPELSDSRRLAKNEGFLTRFRIVLPTQLPLGNRDHTWRRLSPRTT